MNIRDKTHKENDANTNPIILDEYSRFSCIYLIEKICNPMHNEANKDNMIAL